MPTEELENPEWVEHLRSMEVQTEIREEGHRIALTFPSAVTPVELVGLVCLAVIAGLGGRITSYSVWREQSGNTKVALGNKVFHLVGQETESPKMGDEVRSP